MLDNSSNTQLRQIQGSDQEVIKNSLTVMSLAINQGSQMKEFQDFVDLLKEYNFLTHARLDPVMRVFSIAPLGIKYKLFEHEYFIYKSHKLEDVFTKAVCDSELKDIQEDEQKKIMLQIYNIGKKINACLKTKNPQFFTSLLKDFLYLNVTRLHFTTQVMSFVIDPIRKEIFEQESKTYFLYGQTRVFLDAVNPVLDKLTTHAKREQQIISDNPQQNRITGQPADIFVPYERLDDTAVLLYNSAVINDNGQLDFSNLQTRLPDERISNSHIQKIPRVNSKIDCTQQRTSISGNNVDRKLFNQNFSGLNMPLSKPKQQINEKMLIPITTDKNKQPLQRQTIEPNAQGTSGSNSFSEIIEKELQAKVMEGANRGMTMQQMYQKMINCEKSSRNSDRNSESESSDSNSLNSRSDNDIQNSFSVLVRTKKRTRRANSECGSRRWSDDLESQPSKKVNTKGL